MLRSFSIGVRILGMIIVTSLIISGILVSMFYTAKRISESGIEETGRVMMAGKQEMIVLGTQTMATALGKALEGITDRKMQHDIIKSYIQDYRYEDDQSGYYFTYIGTAIFMHPTMPTREGEDFGNTPDANGVFYVRELYENAIKGGGFVYYDFPKPPTAEIVTKVAYAQFIPGTDIWISTGVYIDNIDREKTLTKTSLDQALRQRMTVIIGIIVAVVVLFFIPLCFLFLLSLTKPIGEVIKTFEVIARGDLTVTIPIKGKDEITKMTAFLNQTNSKVKEMVINIRKEVLALSEIGNQLAGNMTETAVTVSEISSNIQTAQNQIINQSASVT
ncbi:MAG: methyl-accepting chemotaxis protein, partial [Treponema sp.]|nr:methyl-accepting chemotaxis protein [Treponema sp.]